MKDLERIAQEEVASVLKRLPEDLAVRAREVPVILDAEPGAALVRDRYPGDLLGLFVGLDFSLGESGAQDLPPEIILFWKNIWDFAEHRESMYREEIRKTYLHELGHYLGLGEDDLFDRGME